MCLGRPKELQTEKFVRILGKSEKQIDPIKQRYDKFKNPYKEQDLQFHTVLEQQREARTSDNLGVQLMEALYNAIRDNIDARHPRTAGL